MGWRSRPITGGLVIVPAMLKPLAGIVTSESLGFLAVKVRAATPARSLRTMLRFADGRSTRASRARSSTETVIVNVELGSRARSSYLRVRTIPAGVVIDSSAMPLTVTLTSERVGT